MIFMRCACLQRLFVQFLRLGQLEWLVYTKRSCRCGRRTLWWLQKAILALLRSALTSLPSILISFQAKRKSLVDRVSMDNSLLLVRNKWKSLGDFYESATLTISSCCRSDFQFSAAQDYRSFPQFHKLSLFNHFDFLICTLRKIIHRRWCTFALLTRRGRSIRLIALFKAFILILIVMKEVNNYFPHIYSINSMLTSSSYEDSCSHWLE